MGNSPSRSELNGEHMPNIVNSSPGRETFQSHSYPTKFSSVPLPGIHNEYGSTLPSKSPISNRQHSQREGEMDPFRHGAVSTQSSGFRTPDPLYSMDSLNVVGNNASSITSAELPPSSISPANCVTDPWRTSASSFSDESINTQCRNLSRLHKDYHQHEEDEGLSSSTTFEGDSLNPEATLSGMQNPSQFHTFTKNCNGKRETTPKPEVAEEAIEQTSTMKRAPSKHMGQRETTPPFPIQQSPKSPIDFSITINGRKVSTCEETPLPLILASQKDSENGSGRPSSKIGITSAELDNLSSNNNTNTLKSRGRMKSPPPPPPITKVNSSSALPTSPPLAEPPEKKSLSSSLNSLFRRNMFSSSRKSSVEREKVTNNGAVVKPIQPIPLYQQTRGKNESTSSSSSSPNEHEVFLFEPSSENHQPYHPNDKQVKPQQSTTAEEGATRRNANFEETSTTFPLPLLHPSVSSPTPNLNDHKGGGHCQGKEELQASTANDDFDKGGGSEPKVSEKLVGTVFGNGDDNVDSTIRPCELGKENGNLVNHSSTSLAPLSNERGFRIENIFGNTPPNSVEASIIDPTIPMQPSTVTNTGMRAANGRIEGPHEKQKGAEEVHRKKTELDCKDEDHDPDGASLSNSDQIKFLSCLSNGEEMGKSSYHSGNGNGVFDELIERGKSKALKDYVDDVSLKTEKNLSRGDNDISAEAASVTRNDDGGMPSKFGSELVRGESSRESSPGKLTTTTTPPSSLVMGLLHNDKSGKRSNSSSRRSSTCSSVDFNSVPGSNGLLNCNRLSLCSLPDDNIEGNEGVNFHGEDNPALSSEEGPIIQDQPLSLKSNGNLSDESKSEDVPVKLLAKPEEDKSWETMEFETFEIAGNDIDEKENTEVGQDVEMKCLGTEAGSEEEGKFPVQMEQASKTGTFTKANGFGHQRRLSVSKIELECGNRKNSDNIMTTSAPTSSSLPRDKCKATRKGSFPELFVNINPSATLTRKHSSGSEIISATLSSLTSKEFPINGSSIPKTSSNPFINQGYQKGPQEEGKSEINPSRNKASFTNDFLQTLGQIYASKSKLISGKTQGTSAPSTPASSPTTKISSPIIPPEKNIPVGVKSSKSTDSSMDTMDFECQDRSISEYNISPRSARQLVTDSMINGGDSRASSSLSQKGIGSLPEVDVKQIPIAPIPIPPVPFSSGVEMLPNGTNVTNGNGSVKIPSPPQSKALTNNSNFGTYKKKPTFIKGKVSDGEGFLPTVDIYDQQSSTPSHPSLSSTASSSPCPSSSEKDLAVKISVKPLPLPQALISNEELPKFPTPPPMPPLHYCQSSSASSSALSSMGDSSEISQNSDKSKSSTSSSSLWPSSKLNSKSSGNGSSECSLVELTAANPKSTSDAIIVELKKAQAKKLRSAELQSIVSVIPDVQNNANIICREEQNISVIPTLPIQEKLKRRLDESRINQSKLAGSDVSVFSDRSCSSTTKLVDDPLVQTIVNGKHTNSIIVSDSPLEIGNSDTVKRNSVNNNKNLAAHLRGNIMSPSLSGNYTEMNGIDSETMGASSIHEDELSGQLQKENHINEIHGNMDEIQMSNKLDGASFRRVLNEYEKTLSMFIQQIDQLKSRMDETETEKQTLIKERDQALEDLRNVESAFSDVHRKYERAKALLENMKSNEDSLVRRDQEMMQRIDNRDKKIDMIKDKAQESIEKMHLDYETRIKEMEFDNAKLRAQYRKMEMKLSTLENDVEQKAKMNAQLNALCDELINGQVGKV